MPASEVMTAVIHSVQITDTVVEAAKVMYLNNIGAVAVYDGAGVAGVLTDRDIAVRVVAHRLDPVRTKAGEVMTVGPVCCREEDSVEQVARLMEYRRVRRVLVKNRSGQVTGIISLGDIAVRGSEHAAADVLRTTSTTSQRLAEFRW